MIKKIFTISLLFGALISNAQKDTLLELGSNNTIKVAHNNLKNSPKTNNKAVLTLPFLDDFSQYNHYPNQNLWADFYAYVNSSFPIEPPSYGVATLDGLDSTGYPYNFVNPTSYGIADYLTSKTIDLTTVIDSVFLSFYYQPQGNGNKPETQDSLRLEFYRKSDSTWVRQWGIGGSPSHTFKKIMIPVDTAFQNDEFQFRFLNYATLSGNVDHWNIDYVYLDENRNYADTALNDVSFITNNYGLLKDYSAMPWQHYLTDTIGLMDSVMNVTYKNNHSVAHAVFYKYEVIANNGAGPSIELYPTSTSQKPVNPYSLLTEPQAVYKIAPFLNDFTFPSDFSAQTKVFQIKNYFDLGSSTFDSLVKNDTVLSYQVFGSYYAYDDGSAEVGYGVQGIGSKLAHEFTIRKSDTLTSFQIYFSPIMNNLSSESFKLTVWSSLSPETIIYQQTATTFSTPIYSNTNEFLNYALDVPLYLPAGTYYFGWEKISANFLNVGFDVNSNNKTKIHFNAVGVWETGSFDGSLMLRPVFGNFQDPIVSVKNESVVENSDFKVYPNPATQNIYFEKIGAINNDNYIVELIDLSGKIITSTTTLFTNMLNVNNVSNGIYFIRFINVNNKQVVTKKVIISK
jgi:hypothetical protein